MASSSSSSSPSSSLPSHIQPQGFAATILGVTVFLSVLCVVAVALRLWARARDRCFYNEDGFMLAGLIVLLLQYGVVCWGTTVGIGSSDPSVLTNPQLMTSIVKACTTIPYSLVITLLIFLGNLLVEYYLNITYVLAMGLVKTSICGTLLRINRAAAGLSSRQVVLRWALWAVLVVVVVSSAGGLVTFLVRCTPTGGCADSTRTMSTLNWVGVAFYMACDLALAVLPVFILKGVRLKRSVKVSTACVLGLGGLACLAAILRIPSQLGVFTSIDSTAMYTIGNFLIWSELELGLGVICGCAPAIRKLLKGLLREPVAGSETTYKAPLKKPMYQYPYSPRQGGPPRPPPPPPKDGFGSSSSEKMVGMYAQPLPPPPAATPQPQSISHPTKTFQTMTTTTTSTTLSNNSLHVDEHSGNGSTRGLIEYDAPIDIEAIGLWGPRV